MQHNPQLLTENAQIENMHAKPCETAGTLFSLSCSPRKGNSDYAAQLFTNTFTLQPATSITTLRSYAVHYCTGCEVCLHAPLQKELQTLTHSVPTSLLPAIFKRCPFSAQDESVQLLTALWSCSALLLAIPIHFYHVPTLCKALMDRFQLFWNLQQKGFVPLHNKAPRKAFVILLAGRPQGKKLFAGSLLSLKYALATVKFTIDAPLLLRGVDTPTDLSQNLEKIEQIKEYALYAQKGMNH